MLPCLAQDDSETMHFSSSARVKEWVAGKFCRQRDKGAGSRVNPGPGMSFTDSRWPELAPDGRGCPNHLPCAECHWLLMTWKSPLHQAGSHRMIQFSLFPVSGALCLPGFWQGSLAKGLHPVCVSLPSLQPSVGHSEMLQHHWFRYPNRCFFLSFCVKTSDFGEKQEHASGGLPCCGVPTAPWNGNDRGRVGLIQLGEEKALGRP